MFEIFKVGGKLVSVLVTDRVSAVDGAFDAPFDGATLKRVTKEMIV